MAVDAALLSSSPGGAAPGLSAAGRGTRAGLVAETAGAERKGLAPTAVRHAAACPGLNRAGRRRGPARRETRALAARATATDAVRPPILSPTSRRHLDRFGPAVNLKNRAPEPWSPTPEPTPPGPTANPTAAAENRRRGRDRSLSCVRRFRGPRMAGPGGGRYHYRSSQGFGKAGGRAPVTDIPRHRRIIRQAAGKTGRVHGAALPASPSVGRCGATSRNAFRSLLRRDYPR